MTKDECMEELDRAARYFDKNWLDKDGYTTDAVYQYIAELTSEIETLTGCLYQAQEAAKQLAQPEQEPVGVIGIPTTEDYAMGYAEGFNDACKPKTQPEQEPVVTKGEKGLTLHVGWDDLPAGTKLYTSPPRRQPAQESVEYQMRMRPTWEVTSWSDWKKCSRDAAGDYAKTPKLHDWEYETRTLYTSPPKREWVGLTDEEIKAIDAGTTSNSSFYAGVLWAEAKLKEKNT